MTLPAVLVGLALVGNAIALNFVSPSNGSIWTTTGPDTITWTYETGTPTFGNMQLLHNGADTFQPIPGLLSTDGIFATGIDLTSGILILAPACLPGSPSLPTGTGYALRVFSEAANGTKTTLGTTNGTFSIVTGNGLECLSLPTSGAPIPTSVSSGVSSSSSSKSRVGAIAGGVVGGLVACLLVVAVTLVYSKHRHIIRKRMTQQFVMKKGLAIGKPVEFQDHIETV